MLLIHNCLNVTCFLQLKVTLSKLEPFSTAKGNLGEVELSLEKVAEIAWKFVTQPNPLIVVQPQMYCGDDFQERYYKHWNDACTNYRLVYARPLVYRSYYGIVMSRALVGQEVKSSTTL